MGHVDPTVIELVEYEPALIPHHMLSREHAEILWRDHRAHIRVEQPAFDAPDQWRLTPLGWVGYLPLSADLGISIQPKAPVRNVFAMLAYAYRLRGLRILDRLFECRSLRDAYETLALILAERVLEREHKGYARDYQSRDERMTFVSGRVDLDRTLQQPWDPRLHCEVQEHTPDIADNQILAWTLDGIARSGLCAGRALTRVRQASRAIRKIATLTPFSPQDCVDRLYNRLNDDYEPMHALCRFFLEHTSPTHQLGDHSMLPFLMNMDRLFELFVAEWLRQHLPRDYAIRAQEQVNIAGDGWLSFRIDLVLYDTASGQAVTVLDTKYKTPDALAADDVSQIVSYATAKGCRQAALIYPVAPHLRLDAPVGDVRVRSLAFDLDGDLDQAGQALLDSLLS